MSEEKTKVIFRKWYKKTDGHGVIAIFPEIPGDYNPATCSMYEHLGQHGSGDPQHVIEQTRPATPSEYTHLKRELKGIGYQLLIIQRNRYAFLEARRAELART
jgi:hypothetical protein